MADILKLLFHFLIYKRDSQNRVPIKVMFENLKNKIRMMEVADSINNNLLGRSAMDKKDLLDNINENSMTKMITCFNPIFRKFEKGQQILTYEQDVPVHIMVLSKGSAKLEILNEDGDVFPLETYEKGDIFGQLFSLSLDNFHYIVTASEDCLVMYIDYDHILHPCEDLCEHHSQLMSNLFVMTAQKSQELSFHISLLGQPTIRAKLMTYLKFIGSKFTPGKEFTIPMSLGQLAEHLHVDRSAMMREIREMKKDGLIESKSRRFKLLCT